MNNDLELIRLLLSPTVSVSEAQKRVLARTRENNANREVARGSSDHHTSHSGEVLDARFSTRRSSRE